MPLPLFNRRTMYRKNTLVNLTHPHTPSYTHTYVSPVSLAHLTHRHTRSLYTLHSLIHQTHTYTRILSNITVLHTHFISLSTPLFLTPRENSCKDVTVSEVCTERNEGETGEEEVMGLREHDRTQPHLSHKGTTLSWRQRTSP